MILFSDISFPLLSFTSILIGRFFWVYCVRKGLRNDGREEKGKKKKERHFSLVEFQNTQLIG